MVQRRTVVAIVIAASVMLSVNFGSSYNNERREHQALAAQLAEINQIITEMPQAAPGLEGQLAEAEERLAAEAATFPTEMDSTEVVNIILRWAERQDVTAVPLATEPWATVEIGEHRYQVLRIDITAAGTFSQVRSFIGELESEGFQTLNIDYILITKTGDDPEEDNQVTAELELAIYTQPPAPNKETEIAE